MRKLLIIDDERGSRESLKMVFGREFDITTAENATEGLKALGENRYDLVMLDVMMPDKDGVTVLKEAQELYPELAFIMVSASTNVRPIVESIKFGAVDFVTKPFDVPEIRRVVARALENRALRMQVQVLQTEVARQFPVHGVVGRSPAFVQALEDTRKAAESDATVLILGESGTGKELIARQLHSLSPRHEEPFVAVHCGALPETLMESELFGHEKGAFTGADKRKFGRFDLAGSGTLFFDEVSEMPLTTQVKLLRVLQEREFMRLGGTQVIRTNARVIAASNKDLKAEMAEKRFREDLYYRLNVVPIVVPPLRERPDDIPLLTEYFLQYFKQTMKVQTAEFAPGLIDRLLGYGWPGNVRELRNLVERMLVLHGREAILKPEHLPRDFQGEATAATPPVRLNGFSLEEMVNAYERDLVMQAMREANGVQTRAAELLGTTRRILKYRMDKLNITEYAGATE
ncbi:MAG TPA: sigma-54 dependent transcriptional regulator [Kiritimatiellia bacterium]|nr:sigma-54 dependent transcriptional regulator [Kiritimatiellia bacterium]